MDISSLLIVGAAVSVIVEFIKRLSGADKTLAIVATIFISMLGAAVYVSLKDTAYWSSFITVLSFASAFYGLVIKQVLPE
jgi:hypothetical protein